MPVALGREVSIATAAHGNVATTRACLEAILRSVSGEFELILVDDCSDDGGQTRALFLETQARRPNTRVFSFTENLEYSGSLNAILSHATGRWVLFVSNDIFITPSYVRQLLAAAESNARTGILRGSSNFVDNGLPSHNRTLPSAPQGLEDLFQAGFDLASQHGCATQPDPFLVGDAFLVSRSLLDTIGAFDPLFFGYFADPDFGLRARIAGFDLQLVPGAFAWHQRAANFDYLPQAQRDVKMRLRWQRVIENWARFKLKYGLPVSLPYVNIRDIPWSRLAQTTFDLQRHRCPPGNYANYELASSIER